MSTPESRIKVKISALLRLYDNIYYYMPVPMGMGATTVDYLCCFRGHFFAIEAKAPGRGPTARQEDVLEQIKLAGGSIFVINDEAGLELLRRLLDDLDEDARA